MTSTINQSEFEVDNKKLSNLAQVIDKYGLSKYFAEDFDIYSLTKSMQGLIMKIRNLDGGANENLSNDEIISKLTVIAKTMASEIKNRNTHLEISDALRGKNLDLFQFTEDQQRQLIKFKNFASDTQWTTLLELLRITDIEGMNYIRHIKSERLHKLIKAHADDFEKDAPDTETKMKKKIAQAKTGQGDLNDENETRKEKNNQAAQIIADHEKKENEFAKKQAKLYEKQESIDSLKSEIANLTDKKDQILDLRANGLDAIEKLGTTKKNSSLTKTTLRTRVTKLQTLYRFSKSILEVIDLNGELLLFLDDRTTQTIGEFKSSVESGAILMNELDISQNNIDVLEGQIKKKKTNLKQKQGGLEKSQNNLNSERQSYEETDPESLEAARRKLETFEHRKQQLKELSAGTREGIIGYAENLARNSEYNYQVITLPNQINALQKENQGLQIQFNELKSELVRIAENPLSEEASRISMDDIRKEIDDLDRKMKDNEVRIVQLDYLLDPLYEDARSEIQVDPQASITSDNNDLVATNYPIEPSGLLIYANEGGDGDEGTTTPEGGEEGKSHDNSLGEYMNSYQKNEEISKSEIKDLMISCINESNFMQINGGNYVPEVVTEYQKDQIIIKVRLKSKRLWYKDISFSYILRSTKDSIAIIGPSEIKAGIMNNTKLIKDEFSGLGDEFEKRLLEAKGDLQTNSLSIAHDKLIAYCGLKKE